MSRYYEEGHKTLYKMLTHVGRSKFSDGVVEIIRVTQDSIRGAKGLGVSDGETEDYINGFLDALRDVIYVAAND